MPEVVAVALLGAQEPRLQSVPEGDVARGDEAVEFARWCGMTLYPWQEDLLRDMCRVDDRGRWSAREVVVPVARQNGKGEVLIARELAGIFLFGEKTILHTAHFMDTAIDAQSRLWDIIEGNDDLLFWWEDDPTASGLPAKRTGNGKEKIEFPNGAVIYFRTRTAKTGRGLSVDLLILDECFDLPREIYAALSKLIRARERAQAIYISSPVNREVHYHGEIFSAKRWAGIDGAPRVLFKEWSPAEGDDPFDQATWARCNPSMVDEGPGAQLDDIQADALAAKNSSALLDAFLVETLGKGNWVPRDSDVRSDFVPIFDLDEWGSKVLAVPPRYTDVALAVDVRPSGESCSMVAALQCGRDVFLSLHPLSEFDRDRVVDAVARNVGEHDPVAVVGDPSGAVSTLVDPLKKRGIAMEQLNGAQVSKAYELMLAMFREGHLRHDGDPRWVEALLVAEERSKNGRYRSLERFVGDVTCLVAASFAVWGLQEFAIPDVAPDAKLKKKFVGRARVVPREGVRSVAF